MLVLIGEAAWKAAYHSGSAVLLARDLPTSVGLELFAISSQGDPEPAPECKSARK